MQKNLKKSKKVIDNKEQKCYDNKSCLKPKKQEKNNKKKQQKSLKKVLTTQYKIC